MSGPTVRAPADGAVAARRPGPSRERAAEDLVLVARRLGLAEDRPRQPESILARAARVDQVRRLNFPFARNSGGGLTRFYAGTLHRPRYSDDPGSEPDRLRSIRRARSATSERDRQRDESAARRHGSTGKPRGVDRQRSSSRLVAAVVAAAATLWSGYPV